MFEYDLEQSSGELLQAMDEFCRGIRIAAQVVEASKVHANRACISGSFFCWRVEERLSVGEQDDGCFRIERMPGWNEVV